MSADGGLELRPSIRAYRENADGTTSVIYASGLNGSQITVSLYRLENGSRVQTFLPEASTGQGSDGSALRAPDPAGCQILQTGIRQAEITKRTAPLEQSFLRFEGREGAVSTLPFRPASGP